MKRSLFLVACLCLLLVPMNFGEAAFTNSGAGSVQTLGVSSESGLVAPDLLREKMMDAPIENLAVTTAENALLPLQGATAGSMPDDSRYPWQDLQLPSARGLHAVVYDSARGKVILFGGRDSSGYLLNDTWSYDPVANAWTNLNPANPPSARFGHAMVYNSAQDKVILFGGVSGGNETWSYDPLANAWTNLNPSNPPPDRRSHAMVYDSARGKVILFGGWNSLNDTWSYDPLANAWTNLNPSNPPSARESHAMVYDSARGKVILFGGTSGGNQTWSYDPVANSWTNLNTSNPPSARYSHAMVYDSARGKVMLFGGYSSTGSIYLNDTWSYDPVANAWTNLNPANSPSARDRHAMVYVSSRDKVILFGGRTSSSDYPNDIWSYDPVANDWMLAVADLTTEGHWEQSSGPPGEVEALVIDPSDPQTLYSGTNDGGVWKSTDGGASWMSFSSGLTSLSVQCLSINPSTPQILYTGTGTGGIFKSSDSGLSWAAFSSGLTNTDVRCLVIDPSNPQTLYVGTHGGGVFKSTDGGAGWMSFSSGMMNSDVRCLAVDPSNPQTLYAGTWGGWAFKSTNGGISWAASSSGMTDSVVLCLAIDPSNPQTLYAGTGWGGLFKSTTGGVGWIASSTGMTNSDVRCLAIDPSNPQTLYAGTWGGWAYKSTNGGVGWTDSSSGLTNGFVLSMTIDLSNSQIIYTSTGGGVFKSTNGGANWTDSSGRLTDSEVQCLAIDPSNSQTLYVGTYGGGVWKSTNGGASWTTFSSGLTDSYVWCLAIDPITPQTLFAGTGGGGIFKSTNGGTSWAVSSSGLMNSFILSLTIDLSIPQTIYAGTLGGGVFKSTNGGAFWAESSSGMTNSDVRFIAIDPSNPQTLYTGTYGGGVFKSTNGGTSWVSSSSGMTNAYVWCLAIDPSNPQILYAGTDIGGVFKSTNGGTSWVSSSSGMTNGYVRCFAIDLINPQTLYTGTMGGKVYKSTNSGAFWADSSSGMTNSDVRCLAIDPIYSQTLYAGTYGSGVFKWNPGSASIAFSPTIFTFSCTRGQVNPLPEIVEVWNTGGGTLNWTASKGVSWLSLAPTSGSSTGEHDPITLSVDASSLLAGVYNATITFSAPDAHNSPQSVGITLTVHEPPPQVGFSPGSFTFSFTRGQGNPPPQIVEVWNTGGGTLNWTASKGVSWLSLAPTSGSSTGEHDPITLSVDASSLSAGTYTATITLSAPGTDNTPQQIPVTLTVHEPLSSISFTPTSFTFSCTRGQPNPLPQTLEIWNNGGGTLNWTANETSLWLSLSPASGSSTGEHDPITLSADISSLSSGIYTTTITLVAAGADNSPQSVGVTLTVKEPRPPVISFSPSFFTFTANIGEGNPPDQTLTLWNSGEEPLNWMVEGSKDWLTLLPTGGSDDGSIVVGVNATTMASGTYSVTITISAPDASNSPQQIPVTLTVAPATITLNLDLVSGWNMISLPLVLADAHPNAVFPAGWPLFLWDAVQGSYRDRSQITLAIGVGYWLKVPLAQILPAQGLANPSALQLIPLWTGWNLIGTPYQQPVAWSSIHVRKAAEIKTLDDAILAGWIKGPFYRWSGSTYELIMSGGTFQPTSGYWLKALQDGCELEVAKP